MPDNLQKLLQLWLSQLSQLISPDKDSVLHEDLSVDELGHGLVVPLLLKDGVDAVGVELKREISRWRGRWLFMRDHHSPTGPSGWLCPHQLVRLQDQLWRFWGRSQSAEQVLRVSLLLCTISILVWACSASYEKKPGGSPHLSPAFWCCSCSW